ncbi:MAG: sensor domain-containing diguanylate cyclase [Candidatus Schekmanbacteria bacterium]|nr:sensor domain-containing diguanylate cyclase [Candidatus Schekmanbacteria bacterium]
MNIAINSSKYIFSLKGRIFAVIALLPLTLLDSISDYSKQLLLIVAFVFYSSVLNVMLKDCKSKEKIIIISIFFLILDSLFITLLVFFTGKGNSQIYLVYYFYIGLCTLSFDFKTAMLISLLDSMLYGSVCLYKPSGEIDLPHIIIRIGFFLSIPFFMSKISVGQNKYIKYINNLERKLEREKDVYNKIKKELTIKTDELKILNEVGNIGSAGVDLNEFFNKINSTISRMLGFKRFCIFLVNEETSQLEIKTAVGFPKGIEKKVIINLGEGISGNVATTGKPVLVGDVSEVDGFTYYGGLCRDIKSFLCVPIISESKILGVISANDPAVNYFTDDDLKLLSDLAIHFSVALQNAKYVEKLRNMSSVDGLTESYNHRFFYQRLKQEISVSKRHNQKFSIVMFDIDCFKSVNDKYGHKAGDRVLIAVSNILKKHCRESDFVARYGGEEFALLLPRTDSSQALILTDRILEVTRNREFFLNGANIPAIITLSAGIVEFPKDGLSCNELVEKADQALYYAKKTGKDKSQLYIAEKFLSFDK